jgi:2,3-dimethylmalate lyase
MKLKELMAKEELIVVPGCYDVLSAEIAAQLGFSMVYASGLGNEASDLGYPDLGLTTSVEMARKAGNVARAVNVPVITDMDTGFGGAINVVRTVELFEASGAQAVHMEDQTFPKRCGVIAGKKVIPLEDYLKKLDIALKTKKSKDFYVVARTDCKASLGFDEVLRRLHAFVEHGAEMVMVGDLFTLDEYKRIGKEIKVPVVATASDEDHFGIQPDISFDEWKRAGIKIVLYWHLPLLSAMKAVRKTLSMLKAGDGKVAPLNDQMLTYTQYGEVVGLEKWLQINDQYGP